MTQTPAGWYADPAPATPGRPPLHRWWDGQQWTEHVQPAQVPVASYGPKPPPTTPDGQRLAGWWQRVGAYVIDSILLSAVSVAIGWSFVHRVASAYIDFVDQTVSATRNGGQPPDQAGLLGTIALPLLGYLAVSLAVSLVYNAGFLKAVQATPGKLALGLRVRLRERPGPLSWGTVLLRWGAQNIATVFAVVPVAGILSGIYPLLDKLWPLWDDKSQALHDKAARTNVVRTRG